MQQQEGDTELDLALRTVTPICQSAWLSVRKLCGSNNYHSPSSGMSLMDPSSPFRVRFPNNFMVVMLTWGAY